MEIVCHYRSLLRLFRSLPTLLVQIPGDSCLGYTENIQWSCSNLSTESTENFQIWRKEKCAIKRRNKCSSSKLNVFKKNLQKRQNKKISKRWSWSACWPLALAFDSCNGSKIYHIFHGNKVTVFTHNKDRWIMVWKITWPLKHSVSARVI